MDGEEPMILELGLAVHLVAAVRTHTAQAFGCPEWDGAGIQAALIATEGPRIAPHRAAMRTRIAELLGTSIDRVNVKGKSVEGLGALAGGRGVAVQAVCLIERGSRAD